MAPIKRKRVRQYGVSRKRVKFTKNAFKKRAPETGVTQQYDAVTQYSRKRMPRWKKKKWKNFVKKVYAVNQKTLGTRTVVINKLVTANIPAPGDGQGYAAVLLYGNCGDKDGAAGGVTGARDVKTICENDNDIMAPGTSGSDGSVIQFKSAILDLTARNASNWGMEVDVYEINVRTDNTKTTNPINTIASAVNQTFTMPNTHGNVGVNLGFRGVTLFDLPQAISSDNWKIYKKRKYFLAPGNTFTLQHRDSANHIYNVVDLPVGGADKDSYGLRKMTKLFFFVSKFVAGVSGESVTGDLQIGTTRKYSYCVNESANALDVYNPFNL